MAKLPPLLTRGEFSALLLLGWKFRGAGLYERQHAPASEFVRVELQPGYIETKRIIYRP